LFDFVQRFVEVELTGSLTRGMTLMDQRSWMVDGGPVQWAQTIEAVAATSLILDAIAAAP
jgi:inosine-uridine nucleoside N-ribohydrolase